jgi:hypothetical protein
MKKIVLLLSIITLGFTSCSKNEDEPATAAPVNPTSDVVLLKKITYTGTTDVDIYEYNGSKISKITMYNTYETFTYTGNLITHYNTYNSGNNALTNTNDFQYDANERLISWIKISGTYGTKETYTYGSDGNIAYNYYTGNATAQNNLSVTGTIQFSNGNIVTKSSTAVGTTNVNNRTFTYDIKNSPFKNIIGYDKLSINSITGIIFGSLHNVLIDNTPGTIPVRTENTYTYGSNDYPLTREKVTNGSISFDCQYIY